MSKFRSSYTRLRTGPLDGRNYSKLGKNANRIIERELIPVGEAAEGEAKGFIEIAGTNRQWSGMFTDRDGGKRDHSGIGRVHTGAMRDAISFRVTRGKGLGIDVGWIKNYEDYFGAQEHGFSAGGYRFAQDVEGMGMFQHLRVYIRDKLDEAADNIMEEFTRGL